MAWTIEFKASVEKDLRKLPRESQDRILEFLSEKAAKDPKSGAVRLQGVGLWRYRVGVYRLLCDLDQDARKILVLRIGHRREVYRGL